MCYLNKLYIFQVKLTIELFLDLFVKGCRTETRESIDDECERMRELGGVCETCKTDLCNYKHLDGRIYEGPIFH